MTNEKKSPSIFVTVIDDILTSSPELGTQNVGQAQGVYVASSADGSTQMMAFTAVMGGAEYGNSLNFFGVYRIGSTRSRLSVLEALANLRMLVASLPHTSWSACHRWCRDTA
ncbi:hypothetical protein RND71_025974 [Anisodus tanguticus]|uniref:Dirigent protein n=1 Tax=Anisodus tanguticus TaxID=243964 RepID=A0AAE1RK26_9SOLA|nr:hypothetical protein RND71_025974 [Anisodus tanguticus]